MNRPMGVACIVAAQILAGSTYMMTATALQGFAPLALVFWTSAIAGLLLLPVSVSQWPYPRHLWPRLAVAGLMGYGASVVAATHGVRLSGPLTTGLLIGMQPVALVLLSAIWLKESLDVRKTAAVLMGLAGTAVLLRFDAWTSTQAFDGRSAGILLLVLAALLAAVRSLIAKTVLDQVKPLAYTGITTLLAVGPIAAAAWPQIGVADYALHRTSWAAMAYLAVVGTVGCRFLGCKALLHMPVSETAPYFFLQPFVGTFLGALWESRWLTARELTGGGLILAGAGLALDGVFRRPS